MFVEMIAPLTVNLGLSSLLLNAFLKSGWFIVIIFNVEEN
jgi:hypothetical protein